MSHLIDTWRYIDNIVKVYRNMVQANKATQVECDVLIATGSFEIRL